VEHDPPWEDPTETRHHVDDPDVLLVHVTAFNDLMWDSGRTPTRVIEHGVVDPGVAWTGELPRGLVVVNEMGRRGRRVGRDIVERARTELPLDLVGMDSEAIGGLGEVSRDRLPAFSARYRFYFHPLRYTSFGMAACEALMLGMPVVALATTEMPTVLENGRSGILGTDPTKLIEGAKALIEDHELAARLGAAGRRIAVERFSIERFVADWDRAFHDAGARPQAARRELARLRA
jgi:glycosyltransferase involved in cell wall biosynthesis